MTGIRARQVQATKLRAVVTRADGTVEDLGLISYSNKNLFKHFSVNLYIKVRDLCRQVKRNTAA